MQKLNSNTLLLLQIIFLDDNVFEKLAHMHLNIPFLQQRNSISIKVLRIGFVPLQRHTNVHMDPLKPVTSAFFDVKL